MSEKKIKNIFVSGAISPAFISDSIGRHSTNKQIGAHSIFLGQVRNDIIANKEVIAIEYSAYEDMANETFFQIREEIFLKYSLTCMHIYHSMGKVNAGEISLFVFTSSVHRTMAIKACEEIVEQIKMNAAIWGKELFADESHVWKENNV